jgi:hypothetical protein
MSKYEDDFDFGETALEAHLLGGDWGEPESEELGFGEDELEPGDRDDEV